VTLAGLGLSLNHYLSRQSCFGFGRPVDMGSNTASNVLRRQNALGAWSCRDLFYQSVSRLFDLCYLNYGTNVILNMSCRASSLFFGLGQVIPTVRGYGIYQPAVDFAIEKANQNCWLHIFPEARVNQQEALLRFKWGVGRIIMESDKCPLVVPMWHTGMSEIRPLNGPPIRLFKPVTIAFGDPIDFQDTLDEWRSGKIDEETARIRITDRIFKTLGELKEKTERMMSDIQSGVKDGEGELRDTSKP
jgi:hypothetical protein